MLAVYDATVAIAGGAPPYAARLAPAPDADMRAAMATAAYLTAKARVLVSQAVPCPSPSRTRPGSDPAARIR